MYKLNFLFIVLLCASSCKEATKENHPNEVAHKKPLAQKRPLKTAVEKMDSLFQQHPKKIATDFDFPVGKPNVQGYYNAQPFGENNHLGDDWNGTGGGNSDLGDPIYSIGNGYVTFAEDFGAGWGNIIRITHSYKGKYYESLYAHCDTIIAKPNSWVHKGDLIGTIGNADGAYWAHLHLEIRDSIHMEVGGGYGSNLQGYINPTTFIKNN